GGKVIVFPPEESTYRAMENVIIGNVAFYGATRGEAYIRGLAGERFCVRNSGVNAGVLAGRDHGCEYMNGGRALILRPNGEKFAAGMSGGIAYVYDDKGDFPKRCNMEMVKLYPLDDREEEEEVKALIRNFGVYTGSPRADRFLEHWEDVRRKFVKVYPNDYRRVIETQKQFKAQGLSDDEPIMPASPRH